MFRFYRFLLLMLIFVQSTLIWAQDDVAEEVIVLENYAADSASVLSELEILGMIPSGAVPVFNQNNLTFSGDGAQFSNFEIDDRSTHLVMGAVLNFSPESDALEFCAIASRTQNAESNRLEDETNITTLRLDAYAATGIDNSGNIFAFEINGDTSSDLALSEAVLDLTEPIYVLIVVIDDVMTVFANGESAIQGYELSLDAGGFAFLYSGMDEDSSCRAEALFAYTIADDLVTNCRVSTNAGINRRAGPGTNFSVVEQLLAGESLEAVGQIIGADGFVWWFLEDDTWMRDDVVDTLGFCLSLPEIEFENEG